MDHPTPEFIDAMCEQLAAGAFADPAARSFGVSRYQLRHWIRCGEGPNAVEPYRTMVQRFRDASSKPEVQALKIIEQAMHTDWKAAAWFLERRFPQRWGNKIELRRAEDELPAPIEEREATAAIESAEAEAKRQVEADVQVCQMVGRRPRAQLAVAVSDADGKDWKQ